jgi:indolepyruvate ferredoxin oxidoreductase alpha subunit
VKATSDPLKDNPVAAVDNSCVGCGHCGEVADAAVLCPSFYRADIVSNPSPLEVRLDGIWRRMIGTLQRWRAGRRVMFEQGAA